MLVVVLAVFGLNVGVLALVPSFPVGHGHFFYLVALFADVL